MTETFWTRLSRRLGIDHPPAFLLNHYVLRRCTCHKYPWQTWGGI